MMKTIVLTISLAITALVLTPPGIQHKRRSDSPKKSSQSSQLTPQEAKKLVELHNRIRAEVGVGPVTWSDELAAFAQKWADHLAKTSCELEHRPFSGEWEQKYGESVFKGPSRFFGVEDAVKFWGSEKKNYRGQAIDSDTLSNSGHYTQLVWKATKQIGCARTECKGEMLLVCNYDPAGNIIGEKPY